MPGRRFGADFYTLWHVDLYRRLKHSCRILMQSYKGQGTASTENLMFPLTLIVALTTVLRITVMVTVSEIVGCLPGIIVNNLRNICLGYRN